jgi:hypothetical protein
MLKDKSEKAQNFPVADWVFLMGRPTMEEAIDFIKKHSVDNIIDQTVLEKQWRAAKAHYNELAGKEAGLADDPLVSELPKELEPLMQKVLADPVYQRSYSSVKHRFGMVELDRLVVFQRYMDLSFVKGLEVERSSKMSPQEIFTLAMPFDHPVPMSTIDQPERGVCIVESPSTDLRFLDSVILRRNQLNKYDAPGPVAGVLGLVVGFGCNFMIAVHAGNRLILNNGSHRAYLLRKLGVTHAPCIIQTVKNTKELAEEVHGDVPERLDCYLKDPRPPMLKDYFDPKLIIPLQVRPAVRRIQITYEVKVLSQQI